VIVVFGAPEEARPGCLIELTVENGKGLPFFPPSDRFVAAPPDSRGATIVRRNLPGPRIEQHSSSVGDALQLDGRLHPTLATITE
jgi:hypothetical protein